MTNLNKEKMVELSKIFVMFFVLILLINCVSAFCYVQGIIRDESGNSINADKINIVCKRSGNELIEVVSGEVYGVPYGSLGDDCSYCNEGIYVNAIHKSLNFYAEVDDDSCTIEGIDTCHNDLIFKTYNQEDNSGSSESSSEPGEKSDAGNLEDVPYYDYVKPSTPVNQEHRDFNSDRFEGVPNPKISLAFGAFLLFFIFAAIIGFILWRHKKKK